MDDSLQKLRGDKKMKFKDILKRSWPYLKTEKRAVIVSLLLIVLSTAINIVLPLLTKRFVKELDTVIESDTWRIVVGIVVGYAFLSVITQVITYFQSMTLNKAGERIVYKMRMDVFKHIEGLSQNQFNNMPVGSLVTRVCFYTSAISDLFTSTLVNLISNTLTLVGILAMMMVISVKLSLFLLIFAVVAAVSSVVFGKVIGKFFREERKLTSDMNSFLSENLSGMKITQIFNQQKRKEKEFSVKNKEMKDTHYKIVVAFAIYRPFINFLYYGAIAVTFYVGLKLALGSDEIVAFYLYLSKFFNPIQNIADQLNQIQRAFTAAERLYSLLEVKSEVKEKEDAIDVESFKGKIEFRHVWFAYEEENWILKDVSFVVQPKQTVAFVGATGAGKTTILSLLCRNFEIQKGQILIDDIDITTIKIESLRRAIGQMLQDVFLFSGTIKENISLHDERFSDKDIKEACDYVNAISFIKDMPKGIEEEVIERGENLSAGQRQLLSFARTVLHKPQILILDEATSNIDTETEIIIQQSLEKMKNIGTMLVVAHRLSTIQHSDNIIVLQNGEILEQGNHQELLAKKGYYYKLYELQYQDQEKKQ